MLEILISWAGRSGLDHYMGLIFYSVKKIIKRMNKQVADSLKFVLVSEGSSGIHFLHTPEEHIVLARLLFGFCRFIHSLSTSVGTFGLELSSKA